MIPLYITENSEWVTTERGLILKHEGIGFSCGVDLINNNLIETRDFLIGCLEAYFQHDKIKL